MASGFIGLFTGAIILTLSYKLMIGWLNGRGSQTEEKDQRESVGT
jgi:hypothetical protein